MVKKKKSPAEKLAERVSEQEPKPTDHADACGMALNLLAEDQAAEGDVSAGDYYTGALHGRTGPELSQLAKEAADLLYPPPVSPPKTDKQH